MVERGPTDIIEYSDAHHTMEFEPNGPPFVDDLQKWLKRHFRKFG
jgi:hypothetical protein